MEADIYDIRELVELNDLKPVTRSIYLNADQTPTDDGLFSYEIFGYPGSRERRELPAYIDLKGKYIAPFIFKRWMLMDRKILSVLSGDKVWTIERGQLKELPDDYDHSLTDSEVLPSGKKSNFLPGTGIEWLRKNYKYLKYEKTKSLSRSDTIDLLSSLKESELFCDCWLVQPAFYRDLDFSNLSSGKIAVDQINSLYISLINSVEAVSRSSGMSFVSFASQYKVQMTLVAVYDYLYSQNKGKTGITRNYLLGKNIDYTARNVICCPLISRAERHNDVEVKMGEIGIPLHSLCAMYRPLIMRHVRELIGNHLENVQRVIISSDLKEGVEILSSTFSESNIEKMLSLFEKSQQDRFSTIYTQKEKGGKLEPLLLFYDVLKRPITLCDIFFLACRKAIENKAVYYTRYPIISHLSTLPAIPKILTTEKTMEIDFTRRDPGDERIGKFGYFGVIKDYPNIEYDSSWRDGSVINNMTTGILEGDHDGDIISQIALFTAEGNAQVLSQVNNKIMLIKGNGSPSMTISMDTCLSLYMWTKK